MIWSFGQATKRFSEIFSRALSEGPQRVTRRGRVVIVIAEHDYERLIDRPSSFKEFLLGPGPSFKGLDLSRDASALRDI